MFSRPIEAEVYSYEVSSSLKPRYLRQRRYCEGGITVETMSIAQVLAYWCTSGRISQHERVELGTRISQSEERHKELKIGT